MDTRSTTTDLIGLRRDARVALELAIVALAPNDLIDRLAIAVGLLQALEELPSDSPPAMALLPATVDRARSAVAAWKAWHAARGRRA
jgi:hypothetical protein